MKESSRSAGESNLIISKSHIKYIFNSFFIWRFLLFVAVAVAVRFVALQNNFLGGGYQKYISNPQFWSWINFDGEHYLSISRIGYQPLTYFYFPLYPKIVGLFARLFGGDFTTYALSGLILSHILFFIGLVGLWKLLRMDFSERVVKLALVILLIFPTSFYFAAYYTESLFFALSIWSFYYARRGDWLYAFSLVGLSTATRVIGIALFAGVMFEYLRCKGVLQASFKVNTLWAIRLTLFSILGMSGIIIYMIYSNEVTGDPLEFLNSVGIFGAQRSSELVILPQVFYRYIFKVLPNVNYNYFPVVFTTLLEFVVGGVFLVLSAYSFFKLRLSYSIFLVLGYIIPTLSGSFSSLPRYVIVLFPAFILIANILSSKSKMVRFLYLSVSGVLLAVGLSLFVRGYWLS